MKRITVLVLVVVCMGISPTMAQNNSFRDEFDKFKKNARKEYREFRDSAYAQYLDFVRKAWKEYKGEPAREVPKEEKVVPVLSNDADVETASWFSNLFKKNKGLTPKNGKLKTVEGKGEAIAYQQVMPPEPVHEQPKPIFDIVENKVQPNDYLSFRLFGTEYRVRIGDNCRPNLKGLGSNEVADAMKAFTKPQYDNLLCDCLKERATHSLSDWAYYQMLQKLTDQFYGKYSNDGALVMAFLFSHSGYKVRMAHDDAHLYVLVASRHYIYNMDHINVDGESFYLLDGRKLSVIYLCDAHFKKEGAMSLQMSAQQQFAANPTPKRTITSRKNGGFTFTVTSNKNYMDFYGVYPRSTIGDNFMTQWVMYAETPLEKGIRDQLYPQMREKLKGLSQYEAVQQLLWWIQTGLEYGYDDEVWGGDRPFFGEESLFYPYCDCEDRAILLSHLVRELVGLDVALVYYPGHLAAAVAFTEEVNGNYYLHDGRKFTVCDPTIIPGRVGEVMETYADTQATLMLLRRIYQ